MQKLCLSGLFILTTLFVSGQNIDALINAKEAERIETVLASDSMHGRRAMTPDVDRAADFIAAEFKAAGLQTFNNANGYRQEFVMVTSTFLSASCHFNHQPVNEENIIAVTCQPEISITERSGYEKLSIRKGQSLFTEASRAINAGKNYLIIVDTAFSKNFRRLNGFKEALFKSGNNVIFVLSAVDPSEFTIEIKHDIKEHKLANIIGVLPGKKKKDEYVIFSAHYDHIGTGSPDEGYPHDATDSVYNGANDDASGTTALIMLANYFKQLDQNERTLLFVAFTAEELGGYGSRYFSKQLKADKVMAMFNIEMIGTESKWGRNSAYITGYDKTNMGSILQKNLEGTGFTFYPDPYPDQELFYRSDNATLAKLGVPAHTISTSKMDNEPNYHKASDEIGTLDLENMAMIIKAIALSSKTLVSGKEAPTRVPEN